MKIKPIVLPCFSALFLLCCQTKENNSVDAGFEKKYSTIILTKDDVVTIGGQEKELIVDRSDKSGLVIKQINGEIVRKDIFYQETRLENQLINISYCLFETYDEAFPAAQSMAEEASVKYTKGICRETKDTKLRSDSWCTDMMGGLAYIIVDGVLCLHICALSNQAHPSKKNRRF